jgi:hypothetical protein|tara:strand:+ start:1083 stop:1283 length:201 start_codon:yes stop_codon:yes gene_type:complete
MKGKFNLQDHKTEAISHMAMQEILNYEIRSHWAAKFIGFEWGQDLMSKYFAWKVRRKYNRYLVSLG